jgi:hypothetical protein
MRDRDAGQEMRAEMRDISSISSSKVLSESSQGMKRLSPRQADAALEVLKALVGT